MQFGMVSLMCPGIRQVVASWDWSVEEVILGASVVCPFVN